MTNNPLKFVDPTGFQAEDGLLSQPGDVVIPTDYIEASYEARIARYLHHEGPLPHEDLLSNSKEKEDARQAGEVGAAAPPTDVDTTGSSPEISAQAATTAPEDWTQHSLVQGEGGFLAGVSLGLVPMGGVGQQLADAGELLPHGTPAARFGLAVGMIVGGIITTAGGITGDVLGGAATVTGIGAAVGVPAIMVSTTLVVGGAGNVAAGIRGLMTTGSGGSSPGGPGSLNPKETPVFRGGSSMQARPVDVKMTSTGMVKPTRGISLNTDPNSLARFGEIRQIKSIPQGLKIVQRGRPGHYELVPTTEMTMEQYQNLLNQVQLF